MVNTTGHISIEFLQVEAIRRLLVGKDVTVVIVCAVSINSDYIPET